MANSQGSAATTCSSAKPTQNAKNVIVSGDMEPLTVRPLSVARRQRPSMPDRKPVEPLRRFVLYRMPADVFGHLPVHGIDERSHFVGAPFGHKFHLPARQVANVSCHGIALGQTLGCVTKSHALHVTGIKNLLAHDHGWRAYFGTLANRSRFMKPYCMETACFPGSGSTEGFLDEPAGSRAEPVQCAICCAAVRFFGVWGVLRNHLRRSAA